mgnify:CR=1 FL=1
MAISKKMFVWFIGPAATPGADPLGQAREFLAANFDHAALDVARKVSEGLALYRVCVQASSAPRDPAQGDLPGVPAPTPPPTPRLAWRDLFEWPGKDQPNSGWAPCMVCQKPMGAVVLVFQADTSILCCSVACARGFARGIIYAVGARSV